MTATLNPSRVTQSQLPADEEEEDDAESAEACASSKSQCDIHSYKAYFRELDVDIMLLLRQPLVLNPKPITVSSIIIHILLHTCLTYIYEPDT